MDKAAILRYWRRFFADLFLGTFKRLVIFSFAGFLLGVATLAIFDNVVLEQRDWNPWLETMIYVFSGMWFSVFGVFHGLVSSVVHIIAKKLSQMVSGLHDLLDLLTREVIAKFPKFHKNIPREELERKFDSIGQEFRKQLRLKGGITGWVAGMLLGMILKALKFLFLDDVVEELKNSPSDPITSSDIEHAVRRVGVELILSPITDNLILLQILNGVLMILVYSIPFLTLLIN